MYYKNWFFDFDDTLVSGPTSWGIKHGFPLLIQEHGLPFDEALFKKALLKAQEMGSSSFNPDAAAILGVMFETLGWPPALGVQFLEDIQTNYVPEIYEDALPLFQQLKDAGCRIFVLSNNPNVPDFIQHLPIQEYVERVFTPRLCECLPKPDPGLWACILKVYPELEHESCVLVGDDPWSEGTFAENCNLPCWIVDRMDRFAALNQPENHIRVRSLAEITF